MIAMLPLTSCYDYLLQHLSVAVQRVNVTSILGGLRESLPFLNLFIYLFMYKFYSCYLFHNIYFLKQFISLLFALVFIKKILEH